MRYLFAIVTLALITAAPSFAQNTFPPASFKNLQVLPKDSPARVVVGTMKGFANNLGVRCQFCHVGEEGKPLDQFDFASDTKRTKLVARQMMLMLQEINRRLDTIPRESTAALQATCATCHHGVSRPAPLFAVMIDAVNAGHADSAMKAYRALRERYYGRDAYDFGESSLNIAAFRLARSGKFEDALALLKMNEELFPRSSPISVFRGNIQLRRADTAAAAAAFREAVRRDSTNQEARSRLQAIGRP